MITVDTLSAIINQTLPEPHAGLLSGILFGTKAMLSGDFKDALIITGTLHIIALSGTNISILIALVNLVLSRYIHRPIANIVSIVCIIGFILFVGPSPSVIRAAIMGSITLLAMAMGKQTWPLWFWALAVIIMLLLNPLWVYEVSFQLSVLAALGIILFVNKVPAGADPIMRIVAGDGIMRENDGELSGICMHAAIGIKWGKRIVAEVYSIILDDVRVTLAAQVFTLPVLIFQFQRISFISPLTNVLIGWLIVPVTVLGFILVIAGLIWMPLAYIVSPLVWVLLSGIISAIQVTSRIPFASLSW